MASDDRRTGPLSEDERRFSGFDHERAPGRGGEAYHGGELGELDPTRRPSRGVATSRATTARPDSGGASALGKVLLSGLVAALVAAGLWAASRVVKVTYVATPTATAALMTSGVHVCYKENFDTTAEACTQDDATLISRRLRDAMLVYYAPAGQTLGPTQDFVATPQGGHPQFIASTTTAPGQRVQAIYLNQLLTDGTLTGPVRLQVKDGATTLGTTTVTLSPIS